MGVINGQDCAVGEVERDPRGARGDFGNESVWLPSDGYCVSGSLRGELLIPITRFQCTWREWKDLHPETEVLALPEDPRHRDARGGHGAEEYWGRPGIDQIFLESIGTDLDRRLPESEMIIGVNYPDGVRAYPIHDLKVEGGVLNDSLGSLAFVILSGPEQDSAKVAIWVRKVKERLLKFELREGQFLDRETGSTWTVEGRAVAGPLKGEQLAAVYFYLGSWHSWCYTHPKTEVWRTKKKEAPLLDPGVFGPAMTPWRNAGRQVRVERALLNVERPLECGEALLLRVGGDRFKLLHFENGTAADDYTYFHPHSVRCGLIVLESFPDEQYTDLGTQRERLADEEIAWSHLLEDDAVVAPLEGLASPERPADVGFRTIIRELANEWDCRPEVASPGDVPVFSPLLAGVARFPQVDNGVYITIGETRDPFVLYRFESGEAAAHYATDEKHSIAVGRYVFRSIPTDMFKYPRFAMYDRPEDEVAWSGLLQNEAFNATVHGIVTGGANV